MLALKTYIADETRADSLDQSLRVGSLCCVPLGVMDESVCTKVRCPLNLSL